MTGGVTTTGLREMQRAVDNLPKQVTAALRAVAWRTSRVIYDKAKRNYQQKIVDLPAPAVVFSIDEEEDRQRFVVKAEAAPDKPANLPLFLETGTIHMSARPFMRPAAAGADRDYRREMETAAIEAARKVTG